MIKLIGYTTTFNVEKIIDVVMPYVQFLGYDKFVVWDNQSTDRTVEMLSKYPFVEIREWDTNGVFDDVKKRGLEIDAYVESREIANSTGDDVWMTFTDFDEVLYYFYDIKFKEYLNSLTQREINCFYDVMIQPMLPKGYDEETVRKFIADGNFPHEYDGVVVNHQYSKPILFHVNSFANLYFVPGNHYALCEHDNVKNALPCPMSVFHFKYYFHDYGLEKNAEYKKRPIVIDGYSLLDENFIRRIYSSSYPMQIYLAEKWKSIDINDIYGGRLDSCWGKLVFKDKFYNQWK